MSNPFVHVELCTTDLGRAKSFYRELFAWQLDDLAEVPDHPYTMIRVGEGTGGGMLALPVPGVPSHWLAYVRVDDIRGTTDRARALGAAVLLEPEEIKGSGWQSVIRDPTGAVLGLWQEAKVREGQGIPISVGV